MQNFQITSIKFYTFIFSVLMRPFVIILVAICAHLSSIDQFANDLIYLNQLEIITLMDIKTDGP